VTTVAEHTGGMIALIPTDADRERLAVDGGEESDTLHLTLAYLGDDLTTLDDQAKQDLRAIGEGLAAGFGPIEADAFAHAAFNPNDPEKDPCAVYLVNGDFTVRQHAVSAAAAALGDAMPAPYPSYIPHLTAGYGLDVGALSYTGPITFDRVRVAIAGDNTDYPLGGTTQEDPMPDETMADTNGIPVSFPVLAVEGLSTSDGRFIEAGALDHRPLPLPILAQTQTPVGGGGHDGANVIGRIDTMRRVPGPSVVSKVTGKPFPDGTFVWEGHGFIDPNAPATALAQKGYLTGNSVDLSEVEAFIEPDPDNPAPDDAADGGMKIGGPSGERMRLTKGVIAATTLVAIPAFADAYMLLAGEKIAAADGLTASATPSWRSAELGDDTCLPCATQDTEDAWVWDRTITASADTDTDLPPIAWFRDPGLPGPTPLTVDDDGRVYGHLAAWNTCHTGFTGKCVMAPRSRTDYAHFRVGARRVTDDNGQPMQIGVGALTVVLDQGADGHAGDRLAAMPAAAHYDNAGCQVANVEVGEDAHGIWVAGALRSTATPEQVDALLAAPLSGDWRPINGHLELIAALGVNTPGFPIPRARVASGQVVSLVAAGAIPRPPAATAEDALADKIAARVIRELGVQLPRPIDDTSNLRERRDAVLARLTEADLEDRFARAVAALEE
jgi:2'-5' RNA ligase